MQIDVLHSFIKKQKLIKALINISKLQGKYKSLYLQLKLN